MYDLIDIYVKRGRNWQYVEGTRMFRTLAEAVRRYSTELSEQCQARFAAEIHSPVIILNGKRFGRGRESVVKSLFKSGGTLDGHYATRGKSITLYDQAGGRVGGINRGGVLHSSSQLDDGRWWHSYRHPDVVGEYGYASCIEECRKALEAIRGAEQPQ